MIITIKIKTHNEDVEHEMPTTITMLPHGFQSLFQKA